MKRFIIIYVTILCVGNVYAQGSIWEKLYGGNMTNVANSIIQTSDSGYLITGQIRTKNYNYDILLIKVDQKGDTLWTSDIGLTYKDQNGYTTKELSDGYLLVGRTTGSVVTDGHYNSCTVLIKLSKNGKILWQKVYGKEDTSYAEDFTILDDGFLIAANKQNGGNFDGWIIKTDFSGNIQWTKSVGGSGDDIVYKVIKTTSDKLLFVGKTTTDSNGDTDIWYFMTDMYGNTIWNKHYGFFGQDYASSVIQKNSNCFAMAANTDNQMGNIIEIDTLGNVLKSRSVGGTIYLKKIIIASDSNYVVTGMTLRGSYEYYIAKIDRSLTLLNDMWMHTYGGFGWDEAADMTENNQNNLLVVGKTSSKGVGTYSIWLLCMGSNGVINNLNDNLNPIVIENKGNNYSSLPETNFNFKIYPNPFLNYLNISVENGLYSDIRYDIISVSGLKVQSGLFTNNKIVKLDLSNLNLGLYILNLYSNSFHVTYKISKGE